MTSLLWLIVLIQAFIVANCYLVFFPERLEKQETIGQAVVDDGGDTGEPLFLSPLISAGRLAEARRQARVTLAPGLNVESYAGYLTVNETYKSNQFFWYFPSMVEDSSKAPVLLWLQGGPGGSSLFGLFQENGPLMVRNGTLMRREHTWALNHNIIYIDNPVGAGFSFTLDERGYCTDETQVAEELYSSMTQFFKLFPELQRNKFFISGESYAGKYVPALAHTIHKRNPTGKTKINLQGIAIGNGWCDPEHQLVYSEYLYQLGLIDWNTKKEKAVLETEAVSDIKNGLWYGAKHNFLRILYGLRAKGINVYNYIDLKENEVKEYIATLNSDFRKQIHVGNNTYKEINYKVYARMGNDFMQSIAPVLSELLEHYNVTFYNGQLDVIVAYPLTENFLRALPFSSAPEYAQAPRFSWRVRGVLAGYVKTAGNLTELMVRDAGHMVPSDQPEFALDLITRVTHGIPFHGNLHQQPFHDVNEGIEQH